VLRLVLVAVSLLTGDALVQAPPAASDAIPAASKDTPIEARFVAEVEWIEVIGKRKATVVPIGPDPRGWWQSTLFSLRGLPGRSQRRGGWSWQSIVP